MSETIEAPQAVADRMLYREELMAALGDICSETLRRYVKSGKVPKPDINLSRRTQGWRLSTLKAAGLKLV